MREKRYVVTYRTLGDDTGTAIVHAPTLEGADMLAAQRFDGRVISVEWLPDRTRRLLAEAAHDGETPSLDGDGSVR